MKVSFDWLRELINLKISNEELVELLPLRTIGTKEVTDKFVELDMKGYNRADLLSLRGVAYEIAAITDSNIKFEEIEKYIWEGQNLPKTPIRVEEEKLCPVQIVAKIEGLKFGSSPEEWIKKLNECGMRAVNNIADVTNLVMLEYGQPLHSFDASTVKDSTINVRRAQEDERIITLDNKLRILKNEDIVLADEEKALDVAGVMGGKETEIKETTTTILLSGSFFNPEMVRETATRLKLTSEASKRFYHGLTKKRLLQSVNAAIKMYESLGGKLTSFTIVGDLEDKPLPAVKLDLDKTNSLIGIDLPKDKVISYLEKLNFKTTPELEVTPPFWRLDIEIEEDLIEEVARLYGYENIPAKPLEGELPKETDQKKFNTLRKLKEKLVEIGLTEVQTYSYFSTSVLENFGWVEGPVQKSLVKVQNPMSKETTYLRQNLWANLVEIVSKNQKYNFEDIAIFEVGKMYTVFNGQIQENWVVAVALMNGTTNPLGETLKILEKIKIDLGLELTTKPIDIPEIVHSIFHPKRFLSITKGENWVGGTAEIHPRVLDKFGINNRVSIFEINLKELL